MPVDESAVAAANAQAIERVLASEPWLVGVRPAGEVVPGLAANQVLHAAPAAPWSELAPLVRSGVVGAALFEGLASSREEAERKAAAGEIQVGAAQDHAAMAGGIGSIPASLPVMIIEDRVTGNRAFHFIMEGFGRTLVLGMYDDEIAERLEWFRDELAPALDAAIGELGGIDCRALMAEALRRGDELHNRNAAATSMLAEKLALGFVRAGAPAATQDRAFALMRENTQFFVPIPLAAAKLALDAADGIEGSSLLTGCGANGTDCGLRIAGLEGAWFRAPADLPEGVFLEGFGPGDVGPPCGDSLLVECYGLGATVLPAAPAFWPVVGADEGLARGLTDAARGISLGEHADYRVPVLGDRGAPIGVDVRKVVETGVRPTIDIVLVHPEPGRGVIGFGLIQPPIACFEAAVEAFEDRYG
ncbi:MAG: DUF1116 domain-containing protein [Gaiellaceae bacterium]